MSIVLDEKGIQSPADRTNDKKATTFRKSLRIDSPNTQQACKECGVKLEDIV